MVVLLVPSPTSFTASLPWLRIFSEYLAKAAARADFTLEPFLLFDVPGFSAVFSEPSFVVEGCSNAFSLSGVSGTTMFGRTETRLNGSWKVS
jgi:hypothetical protein